MNMEATDLDSFDTVWNKISGPEIMLLRGETSDLLLPETVEKMKECGPGLARYVEVPAVGHAPMLLCDEQTRPIREFFAAV